MPPGYFKVKKNVAVKKHSATPDAGEETVIAVEILDDLFFNLFGIHLMPAATHLVEQWVVRPEVFRKKTKNAGTQLGHTREALNLSSVSAPRLYYKPQTQIS